MMDASKTRHFLSTLTLRRALWLALLAYAIHFLFDETLFDFPGWTHEHFGFSYGTFERWIASNLAIMAAYLVLVVLQNIWTNRATTFVVLGLILAAQLHNAIYHLFWTIKLGVYSPGLVTGLTLYIPLNCFLILKAYREKLITKVSGVVLLVVSGIGSWLFYSYGYVVLCSYMVIVAAIIVPFAIYRFWNTRSG